MSTTNQISLTWGISVMKFLVICQTINRVIYFATYGTLEGTSMSPCVVLELLSVGKVSRAQRTPEEISSVFTSMGGQV